MTGTPLMYVTVIQSEPWILRLVCCLVTFLRGAWRNKLHCCWCCCEHYVSTALFSRPIEYLLPGKSLQCGLLEYDYGRKFLHPFLMWLNSADYTINFNFCCLTLPCFPKQSVMVKCFHLQNLGKLICVKLLLLLLHSCLITEKEENVTLPPFWLNKFLYVFSLYYPLYQCSPFSDL